MKLVVISNRVPVPSEKTHAGGLTVALQDALAERGGVWFGWNGETADDRAEQPDVVRDGVVDFATVPLTKRDLDRYYRGYANSVLWPLFHERLDAMDPRSSYRASYAAVNEYFADHATPLIGPDDTVWVQDYHLIPLGRELRERDVDGRIGFFLHTPFPPYDLFRALPSSSDLLDAFFAYDLVGLQTATDARHFAESLRQHGADVDQAAGVARLDGRRLHFGAFPIGIDAERTAEIAAANLDTSAGRDLVRTNRGRKLIIGADRLDYTKGLVKRLKAYDRFLRGHQKEMDEETVYIQIAAPSREDVDEYKAMMRRLVTEAGRINGRTNRIDWTPLRLITRSVSRDTLLGLFSLCDVGLVTPVRDGMNLVAKEFVAAQPAEDPGVLVLSSLAGAADELADAAIIVNPYDTDGVAAGLHRALTMPVDERRRLWETGMEQVSSNTARAWRSRFLDALTSSGEPNGEEYPEPIPLDRPPNGPTPAAVGPAARVRGRRRPAKGDVHPA